MQRQRLCAMMSSAVSSLECQCRRMSSSDTSAEVRGGSSRYTPSEEVSEESLILRDTWEFAGLQGSACTFWAGGHLSAHLFKCPSNSRVCIYFHHLLILSFSTDFDVLLEQKWLLFTEFNVYLDSLSYLDPKERNHCLFKFSYPQFTYKRFSHS